MKDCRLYAFLVFKLIKWGESSFEYLQAKGKCLLVIRRVLLPNDGLIMKDNDDYEKTMDDYGLLSMIIERPLTVFLILSLSSK